jgi:hypothetical protein
MSAVVGADGRRRSRKNTRRIADDKMRQRHRSINRECLRKSAHRSPTSDLHKGVLLKRI